MNHSIPAPTLPPDPDDLYTPPQHLRVGQMARLVWSVMRLASTNTDWAWCTVCRKWYRYRMDFNAAYIKSLFKHCKSQHYVDTDGKLRPFPSVQPTNPISRTFVPPTPPPQPPVFQQPALPIQHILQSAQTRPVYNHSAHQSNSHSIHPNSQPPTHPSETVFDVLQHRRAQAELAHAQATRARLSALSHLPASKLQVNADRTQQQFDAAMAKIKATVGSSAPGSTVPTTKPASVATTNLQLDRATPPTGSQVSDADARALHTAIGGNHSQSSVLAGQYDQRQNQGRQLPRLEQTHRVQQLQNILQSTMLSQAAPILPPPTAADTVANTLRVDPEVARQGAIAISETVAVDAPIQVLEMGSVRRAETLIGGNGSGNTEIRAVQNGNAAEQGDRIPIGNGVNNLENMSRPMQSPGATESTSGVTMSASIPPAVSSMAAPNIRPSSHSRIGSPILGGITKKPGHVAQLQRLTTKTRCEATVQVRKVAERSQRLMFKGTHLYFADAAFQVPSTEEEAIDIMKKGTYDVDKETKEAANNLYYVSWSHTQFFSAQMAALGYRFVSSNLRRNLKQANSPAVSTWLRLEKYHSAPRPLPSADTAVANAAHATVTQPPNAPPTQVTEWGVKPSASKRAGSVPSTSKTPSALAPLPVNLPTAAGPLAPQESVASPTSAEQEGALSAEAAALGKGKLSESPRSGSQAAASHKTEPNGHLTSAAAPPAARTSSSKQKSKNKEIPVIDLTL